MTKAQPAGRGPELLWGRTKSKGGWLFWAVRTAEAEKQDWRLQVQTGPGWEGSPATHRAFLVLRTFKIYSLNNFPVCNTVLLTIAAMLSVTAPGLILELKFLPFIPSKLKVYLK